MNLATATPAEIDTKISDLETAWFAQQDTVGRAMDTLHYVIRDKRTRSHWISTPSEVFARVAELLKDARADYIRFNGHTAEDIAKATVAIQVATTEQSRLQREIDRLEAEYKRRPWSRFHQLRHTDGARIHDNRHCPGLHRSDIGDLGWHPELSGKSEQEAVDALGPVMCSKCFKSAPVEWKRDPKDLKVNPNVCPGAEKPPIEGTMTYQATWNGGHYEGRCTGCGDIRLVRSDRTVGKHDRPKSKVNEIMSPDGSPLKVGSDILKTVRTAEISYTDNAAYVEACKAGYRATGRLAEATAHANLILEALAAKNGTTVDAERDRLAPKVAKKAKQQYGR